LPPEEIDAVGGTLPELCVCPFLFCWNSILKKLSYHSVLLDYNEVSTAYYIRCHHCKERFQNDPALWDQWQAEFRENEAKLEAMDADIQG
jgi:SWI/SNF-related matrix-associated actin-dependent regulator of chromatin subfamily A member 5